MMNGFKHKHERAIKREMIRWWGGDKEKGKREIKGVLG